jgi:hypothetical protein
MFAVNRKSKAEVRFPSSATINDNRYLLCQQTCPSMNTDMDKDTDMKMDRHLLKSSGLRALCRLIHVLHAVKRVGMRPN